MRLLKRTFKIFFFLFLINTYLSFASQFLKRGNSIDFHIQFTSIVNDIPTNSKKVQIWIPYPQSDYFQDILSIKIHSHYPTYILKDNDYGNEFLYMELNNPKEDYIDASLDILIRRYEIISKLDTSKIKEPDDKTLKDFENYLKLNYDQTANYDRLKEITQKILKGKKSYIERVKALYDYVYENMEYRKDIPGYGKGDVERACTVRAGNCIDFHSLFVALANVSNIISTEVANIDIPLETSKIPNYCSGSYHCNVEVYLPGLNLWLPLDISHAKKGKGTKEFYFGSLDNLRLKLGRGRNVLLPKSNKRIPRILTKPYVLIDGKEHSSVGVYIVANAYKEIKEIYAHIIHPGDKYIPFKSKDIKNNLINIENFIGKKYILINFFTTWCGRCQWESKALNKVYSEYKDKFIFLRVNLMEEKERILKFIEKYGAEFPIIPNEKGEISRLYGIKYVPANIIIGIDGKVKEVAGLLPEKDLREKLKRVLSNES